MFVVCWRAQGERRFVAGERWAAVAPVFLQRLGELCPGTRRAEVAALYERLETPGVGFAPTERRPVGAYRALRLEGAGESLIVFGPREVPVVGPRGAIDALVAEVRRRSAEARVERYGLGDPLPAPEPPSEVRYSAAARAALDAHLAGERSLAGAVQGLSRGELLWIGEEARERDEPFVAEQIAAIVLSREYTPGGLNLKAAAARDVGALEASLEAYDESLSLQRSAQFNPYAYIGRAATLRRLGRLGDAYDSVKLALRHYPGNEYAVRTREAILRGRTPAGV